MANKYVYFFSKDFTDGKKKLLGIKGANLAEMSGLKLPIPQGEDVVAGIRTPEPVAQLEKQYTKIYNQLVEIKDKLEHHYTDMQDMVHEGLITRQEKAESRKEFNPMLGHRGCRLAVIYPEIAVMRTESVIQAALAVKKKGVEAFPELMIPLSGTEKEFEFLREVIVKKAEEIFERENDK